MYFSAYSPVGSRAYAAGSLDNLVGRVYANDVTASRETIEMPRPYRGSKSGGSEYDGKNGSKSGDANDEPHSQVAREYHFVADDFLTGIATKAINKREELMPLVEEAFEKRTSVAFPHDIAITLCTPVELEQAFGAGFTPDVQGFCINRHGRGVSEVFVKRGELAHVMLTLGHEIGHALTPTLRDSRDEEAKAFAFSLAWMETIREHNIGGLKVAIQPNPAKNGLHNVAFNFVMDTARRIPFIEQFAQLGKGMLTINQKPEQITI
ncbi:hypothetical protein HY493_04660 [Candidatus Woesearchaeota archaeon]|nr:hypothetical protein [Candidatus Woesearchaeota archaeon]